jgi:citrate synthase
MSNTKNNVKKREDLYVEKMATKICQEIPSEENPYIAKEMHLHGYNLIDLMQKKSFIDVLLLLFKGELPNQNEVELLEHLMIALIELGTRHPATRAAINVGIGKTDIIHILPVSLSVLSGTHLGAGEIEESMAFLRQNSKKPPLSVLEAQLKNKPEEAGDWHIAAGFGSRFGSVDIIPNQIAKKLLNLAGSGRVMAWANAYATHLHSHQMGWLNTGLAAAVFTEIGIRPSIATGLFQILCTPGLLAHGVEMSPQPLTAVPFTSDENYVIRR